MILPATLQERIDWTSQHVFGSHDNACALAYSKIQAMSVVCAKVEDSKTLEIMWTGALEVS